MVSLPPGASVMFTARKSSGLPTTVGSFVAAITVRCVAVGGGCICASPIPVHPMMTNAVNSTVLKRMLTSPNNVLSALAVAPHDLTQYPTIYRDDGSSRRLWGVGVTGGGKYPLRDGFTGSAGAP